MLCEGTSQVNLAAFGFAIGLLALASEQLFRDHRYARTIGAQINHGRIAALAFAGLCGAFLPLLRGRTNALNHPLNLTGRNANPPGLFQVPFGFEVGGLVGAFQAEQFGQRRRVAHFQSERSVGRIMALLFARMIVVITVQWEMPENPLGSNSVPALALFSGLRLVSGVDPVDGLLEHPAHQLIGALEYRSTYQNLQLGHRDPSGLGGLEAGHHLLDFLVLGQEDFRRRL